MKSTFLDTPGAYTRTARGCIAAADYANPISHTPAERPVYRFITWFSVAILLCLSAAIYFKVI